MRDVGVAISGFGGMDNPEPGTPVARALRKGWRGNLSITALGYDHWMTGAWSPGLCDRLAITPPLIDGDAAVFARIVELNKAQSFSALIPCLDLEVKVYARLAQQLKASGINTLLPSIQSIEACAKPSLPDFCGSNGILTPQTIYLERPTDIEYYAGGFAYPLMVKGAVIGAYKVDNLQSAIEAATNLTLQWGTGFIVQEMIHGDEFVVAMLARGDGSLLGSVPMRKMATNRLGKAVAGAVVTDAQLSSESNFILKKLNWAGPVELEFIRDRRTKRLNLIEINNRFPSWITLSSWAGCNLPVMLLNELLEPGKSRRRSGRPGAAFVRGVEEVVINEVDAKTLLRSKSLKVLKLTPPVPRRPISTKKFRVAVTGLNAFDGVMPGLGVAASLRVLPEIEALHAICSGPYDAGLTRPDLFQSASQISLDLKPNELLAELVLIKDREGIDTVLPTLDFEIPIYAAIATELKHEGIATLLPDINSISACQKTKLISNRRREAWGEIYLPLSRRLDKRPNSNKLESKIGLPLVLKTDDNVVLIDTWPKLNSAWDRLLGTNKKNYIVQEYIDGEEYSVAGVCGRSGEVESHVTIKKLGVSNEGKTWVARSVSLPELALSVKEFLKAKNWVGPFELEFIRNSWSDRFALIDFNPRFPAWVSFTSVSPKNLPRVTVLSANGISSPDYDQPLEGIFIRNFCEEAITLISVANFANSGIVNHAKS
jgi:carbamoyl-phosphate synthase large subunit